MRMLGSKIQLFLYYLYPIAYSWRSPLRRRGRNRHYDLQSWPCSAPWALFLSDTRCRVNCKLSQQGSEPELMFKEQTLVSNVTNVLQISKLRGNPRGYICHDSSSKSAIQTKYVAEGAGTKKQNSDPGQWENKYQIKTTIRVDP